MRRSLALTSSGSPQVGGPNRGLLPNGGRRAGKGCSRAERAKRGRTEPGEGEPPGSDSQGLRWAGAPKMLELRSQQLEAREDVNVSWPPLATGVIGLSLSI